LGQLRRDDGQAFVEFVLILPLVVGVLFALIEMGIALNDYLRVTDAARVAARAASVARFDGQSPCQAAAANIPGDLALASCPYNSITGPQRSITITVQKTLTVDIPFFLSRSVTVSSSANETTE
jgi:Flp pilus assembly protein TadG